MNGLMRIYLNGSTTAARPIGDCPKCGGPRYENLVHYCSTGGRVWIPLPSPAPSEAGEPHRQEPTSSDATS